ncbi:uncharacterized protein L203_105941 [Cryptococcus depauperatus CBS 7841]|uniref:Phosphoglycerate mutase n=1 Tax=Cryptococcus depauperatus CBS 7841 TaxID=1295531 RepID=A0AAJ8JYK9_9TREE
MTHQPENPPAASLESGSPEMSPVLEERPHDFKYEVVEGFFIQNGDMPKRLPYEELLKKNFGLKDESPERWHNLKAAIKKLQDEAPKGVYYKVLFLGRHGEGYHNFAKAKYGGKAWGKHWASLYGDGELTWGPDPELTPLGISQAQSVYRCWLQEAKFGAPIKKGEMKWYVSPMARAGHTLQVSWGELLAGVPEICEDWREHYGVNTCDERVTKTEIQKRFPDFIFEEGFAENDELWKPDDRETEEHMQMRAQRAMDKLFGPSGAKETYISITGHHGIFRNLLAVLHHRKYSLDTGEMLPVVVKATRIGGKEL